MRRPDGFAGALVRVAALLVPRSGRAEWRREWEAELAAWREAGRSTTGSAMGAFPHALWLCWEGWTMKIEQLGRNLRLAARTLVRRPLFMLAVVATLALGLGATVSVFSVVHAVLLRPLPFPEGDRIVVVAEPDANGEPGPVSHGTVVDWRVRSGSFEALAAVRGWQATLTDEGDPEQVPALRTNAKFFDVVGVRPELGRAFRADEDLEGAERVVVLSHALWQRRFGGDPEIVGRPITLTGLDYMVVGVMPADFEPLISELYFQRAALWAPLRYAGSDDADCRTCRHLRAFARLRPDVPLRTAQVEMGEIQRELAGMHPDAYDDRGVRLVPLASEVAGPVRRALWLLLGAVSFVLLIACANVASLVLARASGQRREVALRAALGAGRAHLMGQRLAECLLLAAVGGTLGVVLGGWGTRILVALAPADVPGLDHVALDPPVLAFAVAATALSAVLFGIVPVLQASGVGPGEALKEGGRGVVGGRSRRLRDALVVLDVAVAIVLLVGVGLTLQSFVRVLRVDPGFDPEGVVKMEVNALGPEYEEEGPVLGFYREVERRIASLPGVEAVGLVSQVPMGGSFDRVGIAVEGHEESPSGWPSPERYVVQGDYFRAMRIPLLAGRALGPRDNEGDESPFVVMINDTFARTFFPGESPIGGRLKMGSENAPWRTIVGVVGDVRHYRLEDAPNPQLYVPEAQWASGYMNLVVRTRGEPAAVIDAARQEVWAVDRGIPVPGVATMDEVVAHHTARRRFVLSLLSTFATVALVLAMAGIYGLLAYHVAQRTHEIGVRVALGAARSDVFRLIVREGMSLTLVGVALGLLGALGLTRYLSSMLFDVEPTDPLTLLGVAGLTAAVAFVACSLPARRATRLDAPVVLSIE